MNRRGVALLAVLWIIAAVSAIGAATLLVARDAGATASWRMDRTRGIWTARGCLAEVRRQMDRALEAGEEVAWIAPERLWVPERCQVTFASPEGEPINVNRATADALTSLPGFSAEVAAWVVRSRESAGDFGSLDDLLARIGALAEPLGANYAALRSRSVFRAWAWDVAARPATDERVEVVQRWLSAGAGRITVVREWLP